MRAAEVHENTEQLDQSLEKSYAGRSDGASGTRNVSTDFISSLDKQSFDRKIHEKHKFVKKIREIAPNLEFLSKVREFSDFQLVQEHEGNLDKKVKNKIAARESRDRKKAYIKLMEQQIANLETSVYETNEQIEGMRVQIFKEQMHQNSNSSELTSKHIHIIKKISKLIEDAEMEERNNEINICMDSIIYRIGATGKERKIVLSKLYSDLINFSTPASYRYFMWGAEKQVHTFNTNFQIKEDDSWFREIEDFLKPTIKDSKFDWDRLGKQLSNQKKHFIECSDHLLSTKKQIESYSPSFDKIVYEIRKILTPSQTAELFLFVERNQYKRQIHMFNDDDFAWSGVNLRRNPTKRLKVQEVKIEEIDQ